jgi:serine/threonine protein phosphatase PrpC
MSKKLCLPVISPTLLNTITVTPETKLTEDEVVAQLPFIGGHDLDQCRAGEDRFFVECISKRIILFAVLDGHSVRLLYEKTPESLENHAVNVTHKDFGLFLRTKLKNTNFDNESEVTQTLSDAFIEFDAKMYTNGIIHGTTCNLALVDFQRRTIYNANIGDSRLFLLDSDQKITFVSTDHDCKNTKEVERIKLLEPMTDVKIQKMYRGNSCLFEPVKDTYLATTRAFGDFHFKKTKTTAYDGRFSALCAVPEITVLHYLNDGETTLILTSDAPFGSKMTSEEFIECYQRVYQQIQQEDPICYKKHFAKIAKHVRIAVRKETQTNDDMTILIMQPLKQ